MQQNKHETPAVGIMRTGQWPDADVFRVACSCGATDHDVITWIEVQPESDIEEIGITFFVHGHSPTWREGWNRWRAAWNVLWHGHHESEHTLLLTREAATNFTAAISSSIQRLAKSSEPVDSQAKTS